MDDQKSSIDGQTTKRKRETMIYKRLGNKSSQNPYIKNGKHVQCLSQDDISQISEDHASFP